MEVEVAKIVGERYAQRRKGEQVPDVYSFEILRKDGTPRDVEIRVSLVRTPNGSPKTVVHVLDITKQEKDRKALVNSEQRYRKLVETMNDGLAIDDENGVLIYANEAFCDMLGYSSEQIIGKPWIDFARNMDASMAKNKLEDRRAGKTENYELEWVRSTGEIIPTIIAAAPYFDHWPALSPE